MLVDAEMDLKTAYMNYQDARGYLVLQYHSTTAAAQQQTRRQAPPTYIRNILEDELTQLARDAQLFDD
jgi:hypothetical protein